MGNPAGVLAIEDFLAVLPPALAVLIPPGISEIQCAVFQGAEDLIPADACALQDDPDFRATCGCPPVPAPSPSLRNAVCQNAISLGSGSGLIRVSDTTVGGAVATGLCTGAAPGAWYRLVGDGSSTTVDTCSENTDFDTQLSVFTGGCTFLSCIGSNDDTATCGLSSSVTFPTRVGTTYYIFVHGYLTNSGRFGLSVSRAPLPTPLPTPRPTRRPTPRPTRRPTPRPTPFPTFEPTPFPTFKPTGRPTPGPTRIPTLAPTDGPTRAPARAPTVAPTNRPTTRRPTGAPAEQPAPVPAPTETPTQVPNVLPPPRPIPGPEVTVSSPEQESRTSDSSGSGAVIALSIALVLFGVGFLLAALFIRQRRRSNEKSSEDVEKEKAMDGSDDEDDDDNDDDPTGDPTNDPSYSRMHSSESSHRTKRTITTETGMSGISPGFSTETPQGTSESRDSVESEGTRRSQGTSKSVSRPGSSGILGSPQLPMGVVVPPPTSRRRAQQPVSFKDQCQSVIGESSVRQPPVESNTPVAVRSEHVVDTATIVGVPIQPGNYSGPVYTATIVAEDVDGGDESTSDAVATAVEYSSDNFCDV